MTPNKSFDIGMLRYSSRLRYLWGGKSGAFGDISALSGLTNLEQLVLKSSNVSGDISALSGLTNVTELNLENTKIVGNIASLSNLSKVEIVGLNTNIPKGIYGDIASVSGLSELYILRVWFSSLTGDLSQMPAKFANIENYYGNGNFTWTSRSASSTVFSMQGNLVVDNIDGMLNDFSNCVVTDKDTLRAISVNGTRTSASDEAVADLKSKGYTIKVNGITL